MSLPLWRSGLQSVPGLVARATQQQGSLLSLPASAGPTHPPGGRDQGPSWFSDPRWSSW